jgi:hypothetical protein
VEKMATGHAGGKSKSGKMLWGAIAIVAFALVFVAITAGCTQSAGTSNSGTSGTPAAQSETPQATGQAAQSQQAAATIASASTFSQPTPVPVPATGVYIRVGYLGQYNGSYTANGVTQDVRSSGYQVYPVNLTAGPITAAFEKMDNTAKHNLTVEIWENGNVLASNVTSAPFGTASVSATV